MIRTMNIEQWAHEACHDICGASALKQICKARGFVPPNGQGKDALAGFVEIRLTEPQGIAEALATLDEQALWALHYVRCANEPINAMVLKSYFGFTEYAYSASEFKKRFERIQDALINKGLLLSYDTREDRESRYARLHVMLPPAVAHRLPPLPLTSEPVEPAPSFADWAEAAIEHLRADLLAARGALPRRGGPIPTASIEGGVLRIARRERLTLAALHAVVVKRWLSAGTRQRHGQGVDRDVDLEDTSNWEAQSINREFVRPREYILAAVPPGHGVRFEDLFRAFAAFQCPMDEKGRASFVELGERLGFLAAAGAGDGRLLVPNSSPPDAATPPAFANWHDADSGVAVSLDAATLAELLTVARISMLAVKGRMLHATPSLTWIGREANALRKSPAIQAILRRSTVYRNAFDTVADRAGKWVVHDNVTVLKLGGSDIKAVLLAEYGPRLAPLADGWFAICRNDLEAMLAFIKKKGFKPKIMPRATPEDSFEEKEAVL